MRGVDIRGSDYDLCQGLKSTTLNPEITQENIMKNKPQFMPLDVLQETFQRQKIVMDLLAEFNETPQGKELVAKFQADLVDEELLSKERDKLFVEFLENRNKKAQSSSW